MRHLFMLFFITLSVCAHAETYRWIDSSGRTMITDTPPPAKAKRIQKIEGGNQEADSANYATRKARESFPVTLYTSADCTTDCAQARALLNDRGVPFKEKMLQSAADSTDLKKLVGDVFIPSLKVGKQAFPGFEASAYNNLLDLAGYPKSAPYGSKPSGGLPAVSN